MGRKANLYAQRHHAKPDVTRTRARGAALSDIDSIEGFSRGKRAVTQSKRASQSTGEPKAWWQKVIAERLSNPPFRRAKCQGSIEDHRQIALDVRELIRKHVFQQPVGSIFRPSIAFPWVRMMRLKSSSLDLELVTGRTVNVPLIRASCGVMGERMRLQCPLCGRRICALSSPRKGSVSALQ
jgi:hypothetical protein